MNNLDLLIPTTTAPTDTFGWATVTQTTPLRIRLDGDDEPLDVTPYWLFPTEAQVGARVWVQMNGRSVIVHGPSEGVDFTPAIEGVRTEAALANGATNTRLDTVTDDLIATSLLAQQAKDTADTAKTSADGKNKITVSLNEPGATPNNVGDTWWRRDDQQQIIGQWTGAGGTAWTKQALSSEAIAFLDVGKLTGGYIHADRINTDQLLINGGTLGASLASKETPSGAQAKADAAKDAAMVGIKNLWGHPTDTTLINGANIMTGTIFAKSIAIGDFTNYITPVNEWVGSSIVTNIDATGPVAVITGNGVSNTHAYMGNPTANYDIPVMPGDQFRFRWTCYANYAGYSGNIYPYFQWYKPDYTLISAVSGPPTPQGTNSYLESTVDLTAPAGAAYLRFLPYANSNAKGAIRNAWLRRKNGGDLLVDGAIDGKTITGATFRTAATGERLEISTATGLSRINFHSGNANESGSSYVVADSAYYGNTNKPYMLLAGPTRTGSNLQTSQIALVSESTMNLIEMMGQRLLFSAHPVGGSTSIKAGLDVSALGTTYSARLWSDNASVEMTGSALMLRGSTVNVSVNGGTSFPLEDTQWTNATLGAAWTNYGGGYASARYRRVNNVVYVQGLIKASSATASNTTMFTLPAGYRPSANIIFSSRAAGGVQFRLDVQSAGAVIAPEGVGATATDYVSVNISFPVG